MKRILAGTDLSKRADRALDRAAMLAAQFSSTLDVLHVVDDDQPDDIVQRQLAQARNLLESRTKPLGEKTGDAPSILVKAGDPFQEIIQAAIARKADLVVLGSHRRQILRDMFAGTTIERVMRIGRHPVLMANRAAERPYKSVVLATDMSDASAAALRVARKLGMLDGIKVTLLHAFLPLAKGMMIYANVERQKIEDYVVHESSEAGQTIHSFIETLSLAPDDYQLRLEEGAAVDVITKVVKETNADLLIIGTRGHSGLKHLLLGSVADAMLRTIECDILAVPQDAASIASPARGATG